MPEQFEMLLEIVTFCHWRAMCHEWKAQMLQCICFLSLLKQKVSFLLCWLALAAGDGNDAILPFPASYTGLALYTFHFPWHVTVMCHYRWPSGLSSQEALHTLLFALQEPKWDDLVTHQLLWADSRGFLLQLTSALVAGLVSGQE